MITHNGYFADCYVLNSNRSCEFLNEFLNHFLPHREESADKYLLPQYAEVPGSIFTNIDELIHYLELNKNEPYGIYWRNTLENEHIKGAMCFFTVDAKLILGLYCNTLFPNMDIENRILQEMKTFCKSEKALIFYEEPAPDNEMEFIERMKKTIE